MGNLRVVFCLVAVLHLGFCRKPGQAAPSTSDLTIDEQVIRSYTTGKAADFIQSNDTLLVELDIILTAEQWQERNEARRRGKRSGYRGRVWPDQTVPYKDFKFRGDIFSERDENTILNAFDEYMRYTCLKFKPATKKDRGSIYFFNGDGCYSSLGYQGSWQGISLAKGCRSIGTIIHEIGHALGLHHEQTRPDRDEHVIIDESNIDKDMMYNFRKHTTKQVNSRGIPYDYLSIMHYGETAFALDNSKPSIVTRDSRYQHRIGQSYGLSFEDIHLLNLMYGCNSHCGNKKCPDGAFLSKDCTCWCKRNVEFGEPAAICETGDRVPGGKAGGGFGVCGDKQTKRNCDWWKKEKKYCENNLASFMMGNCRETCGWCFDEETGGTTGGGTTTGTGGSGSQTGTGGKVDNKNYCENNNDNCPNWAEGDYCTHAGSKDYMSENCKRSCALCGDGVLTGRVCEHKTLDLACPNNKVLKIHSAMYGRTDKNTCSDTGAPTTDTNCRSPDSLRQTKAACEGHSYCQIRASNDVFRDQCSTTYKYLTVDYSCVDAKTTTGSGGGGKGITTGDVCKDKNPYCEDWADGGFCTRKEHMQYMTRACKKSCNLCQKGNAPACHDISPSCSAFKSRGDCSKNPHWMSLYCKKTCDFCRQSFRIMTKCRDANENCAAWVKRGMCEQNREYMKLNCAKSCDLCRARS